MLLQIGKNKISTDIIQHYEFLEYAVIQPGLHAPVIIRTAQKDQKVFEAIFLREEYDCLLPADARVIVDAGANVGYSALWYAMRYPNARIIAMEPDPANLELLYRNCAAYEHISVLPYALWGENEHLNLQFRAPEGGRFGSWGTRTVPAAEDVTAGASQVRAVTIDWVMETCKLDAIDILKIDVEGAEKEIFESPHRRWLASVGVIATEFHDRFKPGCTQALRDLLRDTPFREKRRGENWFFQMVR